MHTCFAHILHTQHHALTPWTTISPTSSWCGPGTAAIRELLLSGERLTADSSVIGETLIAALGKRKAIQVLLLIKDNNCRL